MERRNIKSYEEFEKKVGEIAEKEEYAEIFERGSCNDFLKVEDEDDKALLLSLLIAGGCGIKPIGSFTAILLESLCGEKLETTFELAWFLYSKLPTDKMENAFRAILITQAEIAEGLRTGAIKCRSFGTGKG